MPDAMAVRRATIEHVFGTLKAWMGSTPFLTKGLKRRAKRDEPRDPRRQHEVDDPPVRRNLAHPGHSSLKRPTAPPSSPCQVLTNTINAF